MGTIHQLPNHADAQVRLLEKVVTEMIDRHPDPEVASRWAQMAKETILRYPGPPHPTRPLLDLEKVDGLSAEQTQAIHAVTERWLQHYFDDVRAQLMNVHRDLLTLQKTIAELEVAARM